MSDLQPNGDSPIDATMVDSPATAAAPQAPTRQWALRLGRLLYTQNPFYVISAWLVFSGLRVSFPVEGDSFDAWPLTLCLMGYTLLLGVTTFLVIRWGKVWDDARSLLLLVVLMFLGISVTIDEVLADSPSQAARYYTLGWLFAATISEALLRALPLRLGWLFRLPFHLLLALQFFYPLVLASRLETPHDPVLSWQLFGFASIAAVVFLGLIPAVRRGPAYVADSGSPWRWPWFPWVLFGAMGLCISMRAYYLCVSLHFVYGANTIFAPFFLVPLGLASAALLLEAGLVVHSRRCLQIALGLPVVLIVMAAIGGGADPVKQEFLRLFEQRLGATPLVATLWVAAAFYLLAAIRSVEQAGYPLVGTLVCLFLVSHGRGEPVANVLPLALSGGWLIVMGWRRLRPFDVVLGACLCVIAAAAFEDGQWLGRWRGVVCVHSLLVVLFAAGYWCHDQTGRVARQLAVAIGVALALLAALGPPANLHVAPDLARLGYPLVMAALLVGYGRLTGDSGSYAGAAAAAAIGLTACSAKAYGYLHGRIAGLNELLWGALFFLIAAVISVFKAGLRVTWLRRRSPERPIRK